MTALAPSEVAELRQHETAIERGLQTFYEVGTALLAIRDKRLYRADYSTFEDYCRERWQMGRNYVNKLITAAEVVTNLGTNVPILPTTLPTTESQARELLGLDKEAQRLAWEVVQQTAPAGKVTAAHVKSVVNVLREVITTGAIDPGTGQSIPLVADALKAAVTEETYERMRRQQQHIADSQAGRTRHVIEYVDEHIPFPVERTPHGIRYRMPTKNGRPVLSRNFVAQVSEHMDIAGFVRELVAKGCEDAVFNG